MGKSCAYGSETLWEYYPTMDNIVLAKMMHDIGRPLPGSCIFSVGKYHTHEDSLFDRCVDLLFDAEIEREDSEDGEERRLIIPAPELLVLPLEVQQELVEPLASINCDHFELEFETTLGYGELLMVIRGSYGYSYAALKNLIHFKNELADKTKGVAVDESHAG